MSPVTTAAADGGFPGKRGRKLYQAQRFPIEKKKKVLQLPERAAAELFFSLKSP